ncbi:MAG: hypothetical protein QXJ56_04860 [Ignisphaera sp.]
MDSVESELCSRCVFFKPHIYFPYIGYCMVKQSAAVQERPAICGSFKSTSIEELRRILKLQGWLYCVNCRKAIYDERELEEHVKQHLVAPGIVLDEAIAEEAHAGD